MLRRPKDLVPADFPIPHCSVVEDFEAIEPLVALCSSGKLYEVEIWIDEGRPLQCEPPKDSKLQRRDTPLLAAISQGFHSLVALLLANGYNPNGDFRECLSPAVRRRDHDMVELLLRFNADAGKVDFADVLETYDRALMDQFIDAGVDPCAGNAVARALSGNKGRPLLGFVKTYFERFPELQHQIDIALHCFVNDEDQKGVSLMLWLGGNPHAITPSSPYPQDSDHEEHESAFAKALWARNESILKMFQAKPIPLEQLDTLFRRVAYRCNPSLVRRLLEEGANPNSVEDGEHILRSFVVTLTWQSSFGDPDRTNRGLEALEMALTAGARWTLDSKALARLRRELLDGESGTVIRIFDLLVKHKALTNEELHELTRTPSMKRLLNGFTRPRRDSFSGRVIPVAHVAPPSTTRGYWKRWWQR